MWLISKEKKECFGCFACVDACPKDALSIYKETDTFLYPKIEKTTIL